MPARDDPNGQALENLLGGLTLVMRRFDIFNEDEFKEKHDGVTMASSASRYLVAPRRLM